MTNKKALVLLDLVNEMLDKKGKLAGKGYAVFVKEHGTLENVQAAIDKAHDQGIPVIFVNVGFAQDYSDWPENSPLFGAAKKFEALKEGTWATELHSSLTRQEQDQIITKKRVSAFFETTLEKVLKEAGIDTILLGGVATDLVVQTTARDGHDMDFNIVILEDLCGAANEEDQQQRYRTRLVSLVCLIDIILSGTMCAREDFFVSLLKITNISWRVLNSGEFEIKYLFSDKNKSMGIFYIITTVTF